MANAMQEYLFMHSLPEKVFMAVMMAAIPFAAAMSTLFSFKPAMLGLECGSVLGYRVIVH